MSLLRVDLFVGLNPCGMAVSDIDLDGHLDITVARCSGGVTILYGLGDGRFESPQNLPLAFQPGDVATGDLDGDGNVDIFVACSETTRIEAYWGTGARAFSPAALACPLGPSRLRVHDLDGDGHLDIVMTAWGPGIPIIWGNSTRDPGEHSIIPTGFNPLEMELADTNLDGVTDILLTNCGDSSIYLLSGMGNREFDDIAKALEIPGYEACSIGAGLLNADMQPDVVVADSHNLDGRIAIGRGVAGGFVLADSASVGQSPFDLDIADLNGDGWADIAVANSFSRDITLLAGSTFETRDTLGAGPCPDRIVAADLNEDSAADLVIVNACGETISLFLNQVRSIVGSVSFDPPGYHYGSTSPLLTADVDLPVPIGSAIDPSGVQLEVGGVPLGKADGIDVSNAAAGELRITFDRGLLRNFGPGRYRISVVGCGSDTLTFRADSTIEILPVVEPLPRQVSRPGGIPVLVQMPPGTSGGAKVHVYNCRGSQVATWYETSLANQFSWNGRSNSGQMIPSGVYHLVFDLGSMKWRCRIIVLH